MSFIKDNLKLAKKAVVDGDFEGAIFYGEKVLELDAENYNALLLIGKSADNLNDPAKSFNAYNKCTKVQPTTQLAWKGLMVLHERQKDGLQWLDAFVGLVKCQEAEDDLSSASDALVKAVKLPKDTEARKKFLHLQLPGSPIFDFLEPRFPKLAITFGRLITIYEREEREVVNKTISKQRYRIGKDMEANETKYKLYKSSQLPALYNGLINSTQDDDERRETEGKLLKYIYNLLRVAPANEKPPMRRDAVEMASGLVVVRNPEPLAWKLDIDWSDPAEFKDLDYDTILYYSKNFSEPSARVVEAFLHSDISPFDRPGNGKKEEEETEEWTAVGVLETVSDGFESDQEFILGYRILGQMYLHSQEYESAADVAKKGLQMVRKLETETQTKYYHATNHLLVMLGTAYTYYQAPKNFDKAVQMFNLVLEQEPRNVQSIIGKGLIFIEKGKLEQAEDLLGSVHAEHPSNLQALFEYSWCKVLQGKPGREGLEQCLGMVSGSDPESMDYRAKIHWRIGTSHADQPTLAFNAFVKSLQNNPNYAPAYTSLGRFYQSVGDTVRGTKCYYKAFELDAGEIDAAYHLATQFADGSEWDLVEVVANRVIDSERLRTFSSKEAAWPYRALGIVGLNKRDYAQAVQYFQKSLRMAPKDANAWIGLGEAYTNSGRYIAAAKAFDRALGLDPTNWIASYQLGIVKRQVMAYDAAIEAFQSVLEQRQEVSVTVALIDTYLRAARYNLTNEFYSQAVDRAGQCIRTADESRINTQDVWKAVGDACEILLTVQSQQNKLPTTSLHRVLEWGSHQQERGWDKDGELVDHAITAFELSLGVCRGDMSSRAMGHYNLGLILLKSAWKWGKDTLGDAVEQLKQAIQLEHRNADFWNAYGIASARVNPRVSQHCFIRSLSFNIAQPQVWTNLGALYLMNSDLAIAEEAFEKTLAVDPEYVPAWLGQGIIESVKGETNSAHSLFNQSHLISKGGDGLAKLLYGLSVLEQGGQVESGVLALQKYLMLLPDSDYGLTIQGNLLERDHEYEHAISHITKHCDVLEAEYETTEADEALERYCKAKAHLARLCLGSQQYEAAVEHAEVGESLSAALTAGLGCYFLNRFDESIEWFKKALEMSNEDQDVVVLLAQVLWAHGGADEKEVALDQLYNSVGTKGGSSVQITVLLGAIGLVDDSDLVEAAREELEGLGVADLEKDEQFNVQEVLSLITKSNNPWQRAAFLWPGSFKIWQHLDHKVALQLAHTNSSVSAVELSNAWCQSYQTVESAQRGVFMAPWNQSAWECLVNAA